MLLIALLVTGWVLGQLPQKRSPEREASAWRRTANGWESTEEWTRPTGQPYQINPLVVGALQVGISLVALTAASDVKRPRGASQTDAEPATI